MPSQSEIKIALFSDVYNQKPVVRGDPNVIDGLVMNSKGI